MDARSRHRRPALSAPSRRLVPLVAALLSASLGMAGCGDAEPSALAHRGRFVAIGGPVGEVPEGAEAVARAAVPGLDEALAGDDPVPLVEAMRSANVQTLVIDATLPDRAARTLAGRLGRFEPVDGLRYVELGPGRALVERLPRMPSAAEGAALARVARQLLEGSEPPLMRQFPPSLRAPRSVELMLAVRRPTGALALWRSSRSSSLAGALVAAARDARARWLARESSLGSSLDALLASSSVEVSVLVDDGTLVARDAAFLDLAVGPSHGPAFDRRTSWHYLLPDAPARVGKPGHEAFEALFRDNRLAPDSARRADFRLYRIRVVPLGRSSP